MLLATGIDPTISWNPVHDIRQLLEFPFMVNAFRAGTIVAITAAVVGSFLVLRRQTFAGHTLGVVGFPGAAGAVLVGWSAAAGFYAFGLAAALAIALVPEQSRGRSEETAVIGIVQALALGCGFLFLSRYHGNLTSATGLLFGSFTTITAGQVRVLAVVAAAVVAVVVLIARPLLFASIDPDVAAARGVPVRALDVAFLVLVGLAAASTSQITGALLVFTLLVLPAATAQQLSARPTTQVALSVVVGLTVTWLGLAVAYYTPYPIGFWISSLAFAGYAAARITGTRRRRARSGLDEDFAPARTQG